METSTVIEKSTAKEILDMDLEHRKKVNDYIKNNLNKSNSKEKKSN